MKIILKKYTSLFGFLAFCFIFNGQQVLANENNYLLNADVHSALTDIHKDMESNQYSEALKKLNKLTVSGNLKDYDAAVVFQTMGYAENGLSNFKNAADYFSKALSFNALPEKVTHELQYSTAQLLIHIEKPKKGLEYLEKWFANEPNPKADAHILAATANYYTANYKQLIIHAEKALMLNKKAPLNWHELLLAGYFETKNYKKAAITLENIIASYPEKTDYWLQLAAIYQQLKQDKKALALYELAYTKKLLNDDEIIQLIKNYRYLEMPYKAATLLEKELTNGEIKPDKEILTLLVDSWILARENEKAESTFKQIIQTYNDDTARLRLGQLYIEAQEWKEAEKILNVKLQTEDRKLVSKINLLLGIAFFHTDDLSKATKAFNESLSDSSTEEQAKWWLQHMEKTSKAIENS